MDTMKTDTKNYKVVCIKNPNILGCVFIKNHIYKCSHDSYNTENYNITIYDENNKLFVFHKNSLFNIHSKNDYFCNLLETRKLKIQKLNEINL